MRFGQNPAKSIKSVPQPAPVTVAVTAYIPFLSGYYAQSLEVLKACLGSIWEHTTQPFDLLLFDNASCPEVRDYLQTQHNQGLIQTLVLSEVNVGKGGAWNFIFGAAQGEYIAYTDSDVYFRPDWLSKSLQILKTYPNTGMVTARPLRTPETYFSSTLEWAQNHPEVTVEQGRYIPWEVYREHILSLGTSEEQAREWFNSKTETRLTYRGVRAHVGAAHFQFTAPRQVLQRFIPFKMDRPMGQVRSLDEKLNTAGYLRLATCEPHVKHMGNQLDLDLHELRHAEIRVSQAPRQRLFDLPIIRNPLLSLYNAIFRIYHR